jgi:hypothetical protein
VGASPADVHQLEERLRVADERIATLTAALAASTPEVVNVSPATLDALRLGGERTIAPDDATRTAIARRRDPRVVGTFELCIDATGTVSSTKLLGSTGFAAYDQAIEAAMHGWRYRPFVRDRKPRPACTEIRFVYNALTPPVIEPPAPARPGECDTMNVDGLLAQASTQYGAGFAKAALTLVTNALACKQSVHMYRLATLYACAARELPAAQLYFVKIPRALQAPLEQRCQQEGLQLQQN